MSFFFQVSLNGASSDTLNVQFVDSYAILPYILFLARHPRNRRLEEVSHSAFPFTIDRPAAENNPKGLMTGTG